MGASSAASSCHRSSEIASGCCSRRYSSSRCFLDLLAMTRWHSQAFVARTLVSAASRLVSTLFLEIITSLRHGDTERQAAYVTRYLWINGDGRNCPDERRNRRSSYQPA